MVKVECDGCGAPYTVAEKRIPDRGLKMRCPKCGTSFLVTKPAAEGAGVPAAPPRPPPPRPAAPRTDDDSDLPVPATPGARANRAADAEVTALPAVAPPVGKPPAARRAPHPGRKPKFKGTAVGLGPAPEPAPPDDLDWSLPEEQPPASGADEAHLPVPVGARPGDGIGEEADLPMPADEAGLPVPRVEGLPSPLARPGAQPPATGRAVPSAGAVPPPPQKPPIFRRSAGKPAPAAAPEAALPVVAEAALPAVAGAAAAAAAAAGEAEDGFGVLDLGLPVDEAPAGAAFKEADLPDPLEADLPAPFEEAALPSPVEAGLPTPAGAALPMPVQAGLPEPAGAGLPSPAHAGLPTPLQAGLPTPAGGDLPSPLRAGLPSPAEAGLPQRMDVGLPSVSAGDALPEPAEAGLPSPPAAGLLDAIEEELPLEEPQRPSPPKRRPKDELPIGDGLAGGMLEEPAPPEDADKPDAGLDLGPAASEAWEPAAESHTEVERVGDEFTLVEAQRQADELAAEGPIELDTEEEGEEAPLVQIAPKRSRRLRVAFGVFLLLVIAGGSLQFATPWGAFGYYAITDALNRTKYEQALIAEREKAQTELEADTASAAKRAFDQAQQARARMQRFGPMAAYTAYLAFMKGLRFGVESQDKALGKQLLDTVGASEPSQMQVLARAGADALDGQLARARQSIQGLSQQLPNDIDVAVLGAEIALSAKTPEPALELWTHAVSLRKSARTQYGLARAQLAAAQPDKAVETAREVLKLSEHHAGARTLIASVICKNSAGEEEALQLLGEVTDGKGPVRGAASPSELVDAYSLLGQINLARSRFSEAEKAFEAAISLAPQALVALVGNGELFYQSGRYTEALARFEAALRVNPDSIEAKIGTSKSWLAQERAKDAKELMQKTLDAGSKHPLVGYWLGKAEEALGDRDKAEAAYRRAIKLGGNSPSVVAPYVALAELLSSRGKPLQAAEVLQAATEQLPDSPQLHNAKGDVALSAGRLEEAMMEFRNALRIDPENLGSKFKLGVTLRRAGSYDQATRQFDEVGTSDPEYPGLALERGLLFEETDQKERAIEMYQEALKKAPNDLDLKLRVASTQVISGQAKQAEPLLREVLRDRPQSAEVNHFLGRALLVQHTNLAEALRILKRATELDPNRAEYFLYLGWAANDAGQPTVAKQALDRALELDKNLGDVYWQLGVLQLKRGATLDALRELKTALEKNPSRFEAYATLAQCYEDQSDNNAAKDAWRRAIAGDDKVALWHYRLGKILFRENRSASVPRLKQAVELIESAPAEERATPAWLHDAHQMLADAVRNSDCKTAFRSYQRVLNLAPSDYAYRPDAERAVEQLRDCAER